jgi:hypothetical protein
MHHLLPTGIAVRREYAKLGIEAQRNHRHASHALRANFSGADLTFAIGPAAQFAKRMSNPKLVREHDLFRKPVRTFGIMPQCPDSEVRMIGAGQNDADF